MSIKELIDSMKYLPKDAEVYMENVYGAYPVTGIVVDGCNCVGILAYQEGHEL